MYQQVLFQNKSLFEDPQRCTLVDPWLRTDRSACRQGRPSLKSATMGGSVLPYDFPLKSPGGERFGALRWESSTFGLILLSEGRPPIRAKR